MADFSLCGEPVDGFAAQHALNVRATAFYNGPDESI